MNVIPPDDKVIAIPAVHVQRIIAGVEDLAVFEGDMMSAHKADARTAALKTQSADDQVGAIDEFDVVLAVALVCGPREQGRLAGGRANDDGIIRRAFCGDGTAAVLGISAAVQDEFVTRLELVGQDFEFLVGINDSRMNCKLPCHC